MNIEGLRKTQIQESLERRIIYGLICEWESALWILPASLRNQMKKPLFGLADMKNRLGCWYGDRREICLSRDFVLNNTWDSIREVLRHEIAHQLAEILSDIHNEPPHGPTFQKACLLLRANPKASGKYPTLNDRIADSSADSEDRILIRIKKLMALAESKNPHEAEAAMLKAHELISKYNIDLMAHDEKRNFISIFIGKPALRHYREEYLLAGILEDFYFVKGVWASAYVIEKEKMGRVLEINGTAHNITIASYIYDFVRHYIDSQWDIYNKDRDLSRHRKTDFATGIIMGFRSKLELQNKHAEQDERSLITIQDPLLTQYMKYRYPHLTHCRKNSLHQDSNIVKDGIKAGKDLVISKGITTQENSGKKLTYHP